MKNILVSNSDSKRREIRIIKNFTIPLLLLVFVLTTGCGQWWLGANIIWDTTPSPTATNVVTPKTGGVNITVTPTTQTETVQTPTPTPTGPLASTTPPSVTPVSTLVATLNLSIVFESGPNEPKYDDVKTYEKGMPFNVLGISQDKLWFVLQIPDPNNGGIGWARIMYFTYDQNYDLTSLKEFKDPVQTHQKPPVSPPGGTGGGDYITPTVSPTPTRSPTPTPPPL